MPNDSAYLNIKATPQRKYDAIVVGSGISGGWAAKELCERGLKTLVLERGRNVEHIKDYTGATKDPWELPHRGKPTLADKEASPVQSKVYAYDEVSKHFFVNDRENPYTQVKPFDWIRGYQVGGRSLVWGRLCFRFSDLEFEANAKDGHGVDWPIRYRDLAPWYDYVERFVGVSGSKENIAHLPDGAFLPPMPLNCVEQEVAKRIKASYGDLKKYIIGRVANLTKQVGGRGPCQYRNRCHQGCPFSGYFSSNAATLPAAAATGNLTLRPDSIVLEVLYDKDKRTATGVRILDAETGKTEDFFARLIFLNASTINTAAILLQSKSEVFPNGLGNNSGQVGHNLMSHHVRVGAGGAIEGFLDSYYFGKRPNVMYMPRFVNLDAPSTNPAFVRGYAFQSYAGRDGSNSSGVEVQIGGAYKDALCEPGGWTVQLDGFGEMLPDYENKMYLNAGVNDKWGLPTVTIDCELKENELQMRQHMKATAIEILEKIGIKNISSYLNTAADGSRIFSVHEMGTARMGRDPKTSVLNSHNQLHDVKNVFITDGACMTSSACQNPSLTYMALTARACDFAVQELKKGAV